jgi:hypothetical protein
MQPSNIQISGTALNSLTLSWVNPALPGFKMVRVYRSDAAGQELGLLADNQTGTSFTDSGLIEGTVYFYLVRAVDGANVEYKNTLPVSGTTRKNYALALTTSGFGTVNGTVSVGENATSTTAVLDGTAVTLIANPNALKSVFAGWTGDCAKFGMNETCLLTMDNNKSATASFALQGHPFRINGYPVDTLQEAYNTAAGDGSIIEVMAGTWPGSAISTMKADRAISVTISGGYDSEFTNPPSSGTSIITGRVNLNAGKVIMNNIRIRP